MRASIAKLTCAMTLAIAGTLISPASGGAAPAYPTRPVKIVVPFAAGGITDIVARLLAQHMTEDLGQRFFVDNRPGAGGTIGSEIVARAAPDGYTLEIASAGTHAINVSLYPHLTYDPIKDFTPISLVSWEANLLIVPPTVPAKTLPDLVAAIKAKPQTYNYGTAGFGSTTHLAMELFKMMSGTAITPVAYKGASEVTEAVISRQVDLAFNGTSTALAPVRAGTVRALGISSQQRSPLLPDVPAIAETLPGFEALAWHGLVAPAGTPPEIVDILAREAQSIVHDPKTAAHMRDLGASPQGTTPAAFHRFMVDEIRKWAKVVKASGAKVD